MKNIDLEDQITILSCIYMFHLECISHWFTESTKCFLCQFEITEKEIKYVIKLIKVNGKNPK